MSAQFWLSVLFLVVIVAIYIWDAYVLATGRPGESVSVVIRDWTEHQPMLAFAVGVLVGHVFW